MLTVSEVAQRLSTSKFAVYDLINSGTLPAVNIGQEGKRAAWRVLESELHAWLEARRRT